MTQNELLHELSKLNHIEKLRVVQYLINEMAVEEESLLKSGVTYEAWSPFDSAGAAQTLQAMLD